MSCDGARWPIPCHFRRSLHLGWIARHPSIRASNLLSGLPQRISSGGASENKPARRHANGKRKAHPRNPILIAWLISYFGCDQVLGNIVLEGTYFRNLNANDVSTS